MEKTFKRTLVTSALPYANGPVHIGHLAGVYVPADIYVRYLRLCGHDVVFVGGSDEHGVPITIKAKKEGVTPQDIVDRYHRIIKDSMAELGISFDVYSRTSSELHAATASEFFRRLYDNGQFVEKTSMQLYDEKAQQFLADRYVTGECPHCHNPRAYGDQCEVCGTSLQRHRSHQSAVRDHRQRARAARDPPLVSAARPLGAYAAQVDTRRSSRMEDQRVRPVQVVARHGAAAPRGEP